MTSTLAEAGATVIAEPTPTPWNSLNARLEAPAGLQLTLFQELGDVRARIERACESNAMRFVCVADLHGYLPRRAPLRRPARRRRHLPDRRRAPRRSAAG